MFLISSKAKSHTRSRLTSHAKAQAKATVQTTLPPGPLMGCIWLYDSCDYSGTPVEICSPNPNFIGDGYNYDNLASGIRLGPQTTATLYIDINFSGNQYTFISDVICFKTASDLSLRTFDNQSSSVNILSPNQQSLNIDSPREGCVWLYDGCNYTKRAVEFCSSLEDFKSSPYNFKSLASSIKLGPNTYASLYSRLKMDGNSATFLQNNACFASDSNSDVRFMDNQATSIYLWTQPTQGCAWVYEDCAFGGKRQTVCGQSSDLDTLDPKFSDKISSVRLGPNTSATLWKGKGYSLESIAMSQDESCFATDEKQRVRDMDNHGNSMKLFTQTPNTDTPPDGCIYLYQDCGFNGRKVSFCGNDNDLFNNNFDDLASAIRLGAGITVELFKNKNFNGLSTIVKGDKICFATDADENLRDLNNLVSSLKIVKAGKKPCTHAHP